MSKYPFAKQKFKMIQIEMRKPCFLCIPFPSRADALLPCATNDNDILRSHLSITGAFVTQKRAWYMAAIKKYQF